MSGTRIKCDERRVGKNFKSFQDFSVGLYDGFYLNFITALPRPNLEDLAKSAVQCDVVNHVHKVNLYFRLRS